jgi:hypothetical protein
VTGGAVGLGPKHVRRRRYRHQQQRPHPSGYA